MRTLSIREMRASLGQLDRILEGEREIVITRRGRAIARLLPFQPRSVMPSHVELRAEMPELTSSAELIREDRESR
ncbi:MAG: type II toxin-antitoxin system Phd/YefM family antitoxin [Acidobacteriota bacterium]